MSPLILERASASRQSGQWRDDDYDVLEDGVIVGRIFLSLIAPKDTPWFWSLAHARPLGPILVVPQRLHSGAR